MKAESIVLTVAGMCFGVIVGWILANVDSARAVAVAPALQQAATGDQGQPPALDEARVQALTTILESDPKNSGAAVQLGTAYFEAERFEEAATWYERALQLDPKNADASTQLGMTYFFTRGADLALEQLERSLQMSPNHPRTLLNKGIVLWRGKQDLKRASETWQTLVKAAPDSPEAELAQQGLQAIAGGRGGGAGTTPTNQ